MLAPTTLDCGRTGVSARLVTGRSHVSLGDGQIAVNVGVPWDCWSRVASGLLKAVDAGVDEMGRWFRGEGPSFEPDDPGTVEVGPYRAAQVDVSGAGGVV